jgi:hypothetical protein
MTPNPSLAGLKPVQVNPRLDDLHDGCHSPDIPGYRRIPTRQLQGVSLAVSFGANVKAVQRMLGHASAAMTLDVYLGLFDDDLDGLADRMDEVHVYSLCTTGKVGPIDPKSNVSNIRSATTESA